MDGVVIRQIVGRMDGLAAPVKTLSEMIYAEIAMPPGTRYRVPSEQIERAFYLIEGAVTVDGQSFAPAELVILKPHAEIVLASERGARLVLVGGEPFPEQRFIYWNFVSSRAERIEQAKADWRAQAFAAVPGEHEFIPLPDDPPQPVRYPSYLSIEKNPFQRVAISTGSNPARRDRVRCLVPGATGFSLTP
jgi:hypothetical protein